MPALPQPLPPVTPPIPKPKAAVQPPRIERHEDDPIAILAQAAAELGIRDADSVSLAGVAEAVREIIPEP